MLGKLPAKIALLRRLLDERLGRNPHIREVRQRGLMVGIELRENRGAQVCREARRHGVILRPLGLVVVLMPPLAISTEELHLLVSAAARAIDRVFGGVFGT